MKVGAGETAVKTCTKCGIELVLGLFRQRKLKSGNGFYYIGECKVCEREKQKKYRLENLEKCKSALAAWKKINPDVNSAHSRKSYAKRRKKCRETMLRWISVNRNRYLSWLRDYGKRQSCLLTDRYVRHELQKRSPLVTDDLISMKRAQLQIHRAVKQTKQILKEKTIG